MREYFTNTNKNEALLAQIHTKVKTVHITVQMTHASLLRGDVPCGAL